MQEMLDVTDHVAKTYHIEFGMEKTKVMKIYPKPINKKNTITKWLERRPFTLGNQPIQETETYKYLGEMQNDEGSNTDHIREVKKKTEAAFQTMLQLAGNQQFYQIQMETIWKLLESCVEPCILYASEVMDMN